jgi:hypothetical protein
VLEILAYIVSQHPTHLMVRIEFMSYPSSPHHFHFQIACENALDCVPICREPFREDVSGKNPFISEKLRYRLAKIVYRSLQLRFASKGKVVRFETMASAVDHCENDTFFSKNIIQFSRYRLVLIDNSRPPTSLQIGGSGDYCLDSRYKMLQSFLGS